MLCMCGSAATILRMFNIIIIAVNRNDNAILLIAVCMGRFGANDATVTKIKRGKICRECQIKLRLIIGEIYSFNAASQ